MQLLVEGIFHMIKKIYVFMMLLGLALILLAIMPIIGIGNRSLEIILTSDMLNNILISLGCGIITSTLVSFYIERSNKILDEKHSTKMKRNILNDLIETVEYYSDEDFDFIKIEKMIMSDFLKEVVKSCEMYIPMGIQFYTDEELKIIKQLYHNSLSIISILKEQDIYNLYNKYSEVFSEAVNFKFAHGPYSEEEKMKRVCRALELDYIDSELCKIGEVVFLYHIQNESYKRFLSVFSYLK